MIETLPDSLQPVTSWILFASLKSLIIIPLVLLIRRLTARSLSPHSRYGLWFAVIACLSIPIGGQMRIGNELRNVTSAPSEVVSQVAISPLEQSNIKFDAPSVTASNLSPKSMAILIWLAGIASLAAAVFLNSIRCWRMTSQASKVDAATDALFTNCKQLLKVRQYVKLLETSRIESPILVGYWRPTLLLPRHLSAQIRHEQMRLVLLHELMHVRRHDILANWTIALVQIAHWFNPLVWFALRVMRNDMEHACDASVLRHLSGTEKLEYGNTLIRLADYKPQRTLLAQHASVIDRPSQLKERINMIAQFRSRSIASSLLGAALVMLTSTLAVTQAASTTQQPASPASRAAPAVVSQPAPESNASTAVAPPAPQPRRSAPKAPELESAQIPIRYRMANDLAGLIASPTYAALFANHTLSVDLVGNFLRVHGTAADIAAVRQIVAKLDVPRDQVEARFVLALVENDFVQQLTGGASEAISSLVLGSGHDVVAALEAEQRAGRASILSSAQKLVVTDGAQGYYEQGGGVHQFRVRISPTMQPDKSMNLDIDIRVDTILGTINAQGYGPAVPSIDTRQLKTQVLMDSGATVLLGGMAERDGRHLIALVTPQLMPASPATPK